MVAVSNDDNKILILAVKSPFTELGAIDSWRAEVLDCFTLDHQQPNIDSSAFTFDDMLDEQIHATNLSWSPWVSTDDGLHSVLAYATNTGVRLRAVSFQEGRVEVGKEMDLDDIELRFAGPVSWSPDSRDETLLLALFGLKGVVIHTIRVADASSLDRKTHDLNGRWDVVSGVVWDTADPEHTRLHFSSNMMTTKCPTAVLEVTKNSLEDISTLDWPYWREHISGSQGHFSAEHNLKGNANAKVWGLSRSPLGEYIASCHTVHPTDMIEYGTPADRRTHIAITTLRGRGGDLEFPRRPVSTEAIFFSARKWIEKNVESAEDLPVIQSDVQQKLMEAYLPDPSASEEQEVSFEREETPLRALVSAFQRSTLNNPRIIEDRFEILSHLICTPVVSTELPRMTIAYRLAEAVSSLPSLLSSNDTTSQAILDAHQRLMRFIDSILSIPNTEEDTGSPLAIPLLLGAEQCVFCDAPIPFQDQAKAVCPNGHEFSRCGLSFLAIQSPGCTKTCGICSTRFLQDEVILEVNAERGEADEDAEILEEDRGQPLTTEGELRPTLARVLFLACDACIYCGGKFVG